MSARCHWQTYGNDVYDGGDGNYYLPVVAYLLQSGMAFDLNPDWTVDIYRRAGSGADTYVATFTPAGGESGNPSQRGGSAPYSDLTWSGSILWDGYGNGTFWLRLVCHYSDGMTDSDDTNPWAITAAP